MPSISEDSTVELIAQIFCGEGKRNKAGTLRTVGYAESTCVSGKARADIYESLRVKEAIARIDAENRAVSGWSAEKMHKQYNEDRTFAKLHKQPSACISASVAIARLYAMDKDAGVKDATALELSKEALDALRAEAAIVNKQSIAKPTLYREHA